MSKIFVENKKARFNFEIVEELESGIKLLGTETKSIKNGKATLDGAYITIRGGEAFLINANIPPFQVANTSPDYEPARNRKLLITKKEIAKLATVENQNGLTIVPISMYNKNNLIKVRVAIVRGKKKHDKRETLKKRATERDIRRTLKYE